MASFFEKLKKGMSIEEPIEEPEEEKEIKKTTDEENKSSSLSFAAARMIKTKAGKKPKKSLPKSPQDYTKQVKKLEIQTEQPEEKEKKIEEQVPKESKKQKEKKWLSFNEEEGQLAIDVYQTENDLVIQSAIAGVKPENLDISIEKDIIIIKGKREKPLEENGDYFTQECFFGPFSREIIMPAEVDSARTAAEMKNGILTIRIPKVLKEKKRKITVRE